MEKFHDLEVEPYNLAVINSSLTHFPHLSSGSLDDSYVSIDTTADEKELGVSWDVVRTLQKFFYPGSLVIMFTYISRRVAFICCSHAQQCVHYFEQFEKIKSRH